MTWPELVNAIAAWTSIVILCGWPVALTILDLWRTRNSKEAAP